MMVRGVCGALVLLAGVSLVLCDIPSDHPTVPIRGVSGLVRMPLVGIGTWQYNDSVAQGAVETAFSLGYRHVDTANNYRNQVGVGKGLVNAGVPREEYFITTKIPPGMDAEETKETLDLALVQLQTSYVDLMLIHFPDSDYATRKAQWLTLEDWAKSGKARAIGISHYCRSHVEEILSYGTLPIAVNQNEYHVGMGPETEHRSHDKAFMEANGIVYEAYSSLCGPCGSPDNMELINGTLVTSIGKNHNKTGAQIALKWVVQQGIPVIPKSTNPKHILANFQLFDFTLSDYEMAALTATNSPPQVEEDAKECENEAKPRTIRSLVPGLS